MNERLNSEELALLALLRAALRGEGVPREAGDPALNWARLCAIAEKHAVLPLLCPLLEGRVPEALWRPAAERCAVQFYRLLFLTRYYVTLLREQGIAVIVMKGAGAARYYPTPEHRKSGDIDLLLPEPEQLDRALEILLADGAQAEAEQHANHHRSFLTPEGITLELHLSLTEDFDNARINALAAGAQREMAESCVFREILPGVKLPVPDGPMQAVSLLLHMLQHFLRAGFGLKLLCDWVALWNGLPEGEDMARYERFVDESGLRGFTDILASVCIRYLGLCPERLRRAEDFDDELCRDFLREVFDAEEFGRSAAQRMVMVRGGPVGYLREFHHQMRLNYPRAGRCFLLWPVLWAITLFRFLYNNRALRKISLGEVLLETERRSRLMEPMHLFKR